MFREYIIGLSDLLFCCRRGFTRIAEKKSIWHGLALYLTVKFFVYLTAINLNITALRIDLIFPSWPAHFFAGELVLKHFQIVPLSTIFLHLSFGPLCFFFMVAILHFVALLFGGQNRVSALGAVFGYAYLPYLIVGIGILLARYTGFNLIGPLLLVAFIWSLLLKIAGLKLIYSFSWGQAIFVFFMPFLAFMLSFLLFLLFAIVFLIPIVLQIMDSFSLSFPFA